MAAKMKLMKMLQEIRGFAEITQRLPQQRPPGLFIMQMRSHVLQTTVTRRRRTIAIQMLETPNIPDAVKIRHVPTVVIQPAAQ
jgi:hypothetical protein